MEKGEENNGEVGGEENLGEKLRREVVVGKKGGPSTPVLSWRFWALQDSIINQKPFPNTVSARKLGAALWEFQHYLPLPQMNRGFSNGVAGADSSLRRHPSHKNKGLDLSRFPGDAHRSSTYAEQPAIASNLQKHVASELVQHGRSDERIKQKNNHGLQPESPPICSSSMEVTPYDPAVIPTSPLRAKGRIPESKHGLKTSTELLKVLNRIWSLEEQHMSNISLIKALKAELDHARVKIKDLLHQCDVERGEIDGLIKQFAEEKLVRKKKEKKQIEAAIKSAKDEFEDERRLRKRSESLHQKLARDLSEAKISLSNALKDLEIEKKSRILLEDLCDEFARGIKDYEQDMHGLKQKSDKSCVGRNDHGRLILHMSESWLDERMQMEKDAQNGIRMEKSSVVEKLYFEMESFLQEKHGDADKICGNLLPGESIQMVGDNQDSIDKPSGHNLTPNGNGTTMDGAKVHLRSRERTKSRTPSSLQVKFEEKMAWAMSQSGTGTSHKSEHCEGADEDDEGKRRADNKIHELALNKMVNEGGSKHPQNNYGEASCSKTGWRNRVSPEEDVSGSSSKVALGVEAGSRGHRSRLKGS